MRLILVGITLLAIVHAGQAAEPETVKPGRMNSILNLPTQQPVSTVRISEFEPFEMNHAIDHISLIVWFSPDGNSVFAQNYARAFDSFRTFIYFWPYWLGLISLLFSLLAIRRLVKAKRRKKLPWLSCTQCGYDRERSQTPHCPECGCKKIVRNSPNARNSKQYVLPVVLLIVPTVYLIMFLSGTPRSLDQRFSPSFLCWYWPTEKMEELSEKWPGIHFRSYHYVAEYDAETGELLATVFQYPNSRRDLMAGFSHDQKTLFVTNSENTIAWDVENRTLRSHLKLPENLVNSNEDDLFLGGEKLLLTENGKTLLISAEKTRVLDTGLKDLLLPETKNEGSFIIAIDTASLRRVEVESKIKESVLIEQAAFFDPINQYPPFDMSIDRKSEPLAKVQRKLDGKIFEVATPGIEWANALSPDGRYLFYNPRHSSHGIDALIKWDLKESRSALKIPPSLGRHPWHSGAYMKHLAVTQDGDFLVAAYRNHKLEKYELHVCRLYENDYQWVARFQLRSVEPGTFKVASAGKSSLIRVIYDTNSVGPNTETIIETFDIAPFLGRSALKEVFDR